MTESVAYRVNTIKLASKMIPACLRTIPSPPKQLFYQGVNLDELLERPRVAIVGSRSISPYGQQVTEQLAAKLAERGIVIVSGLALGVDALAHRSALEVGGVALAVLPSPLSKIYPATNRHLADQILKQNGALVSEYEDGSYSFKQNFIARNRLVAGLAQAVLITEGAEKSGSLHTARFALEQGKDVLAVPGNIISRVSVGTNNLIKSGATPVTSYEDVLHALGLEELPPNKKAARGRNDNEQRVLDLLANGVGEGEQLIKQSGLSVSDFNRALTMLEISGKVRPLGSNQWSLC